MLAPSFPWNNLRTICLVYVLPFFCMFNLLKWKSFLNKVKASWIICFCFLFHMYLLLFFKGKNNSLLISTCWCSLYDWSLLALKKDFLTNITVLTNLIYQRLFLVVNQWWWNRMGNGHRGTCSSTFCRIYFSGSPYISLKDLMTANLHLEI